jgi:hypothetical protein
VAELFWGMLYDSHLMSSGTVITGKKSDLRRHFR